MARCSYGSVPAAVTQFTISLVIVNGGGTSNSLTLSFPGTSDTRNPSNENNYSRVIRYQCKDVLSGGGGGAFNTGWYIGLEDPQLWTLSYSYNLYSTSLGADFGGAVQGFECPSTVPDATMVKYASDRYWPDLRNGPNANTTAGPFGLDPRCGTDINGNNCAGIAGISFDGRATPWNTGVHEYDPRGTIFGKAGDVTTAGTDIDNTSDDEPYDMTLWSAAPLAGYDNVIYPTNIDQGAKTTVGVQNGSNCTDGTDADNCKCVSGDERHCRHYQANRHDFYLANFLDNTFRQPFCTPHSVGGASGASSLGAALDCSVDPNQTPIVTGADVLGFAALPNASGQCPNLDLPTGKKWGLLWHFRAQLDVRSTINITNPNDIGQLACTRREYECIDPGNANAASASCNILDSSCAPANLIGVTYCNSAVNANSSEWRIGPQQGSAEPGQRFGNCLDISGMNAPGDRGWCNLTNGSAPYFQRLGNIDADNDYSSSVNWALATNPSTGCNDPMQLYNQNSLWTTATGPNFFTGVTNNTSTGCYSIHNKIINTPGTPDAANDARGFSGSSGETHDWQGFPFIAGDFSSLASGRSESMRGVGFGGNWCSPVLPGNRWTQGTSTLSDIGGTQISRTPDSVNNQIGWNDGLDVWLVGTGRAGACIEADVSANNSSTSEITGFLYNPFARSNTTSTALSFGGGAGNPFDYWLRLPGSSQSQGYPGLVSEFPKTIKNWFDFLGIGCNGRCDNSDANNSYPPMKDWRPGRSRQTGLLGALADSIAIVANAFRTGAHSSTDSWGGYGVFQFGSSPLEATSREDHIYVVSRTGITMNQMENDAALRLQYTPVRYIRGTRVIYELVSNSSDTSTPEERLPLFPLCVLQDNGETSP
jgi:hypothetical protein